MAIQFISHNLAVISEVSDEIIVMYAGRIVEARQGGGACSRARSILIRTD